ncbi:hypothetical protein [Microbacterium immunditiarum]|uniref:DUF4878 domain-containing protein n=1 Tax=Microbacterium immunditiarum TaxID=337480 RepID=A0A7Y9KL31_9MICO|nr:hypothetical protein [Microbacterium immunditiarum]NYE19823.1 hypothetical protein [Microbacterium immunditiarum]
MRRGAVIGIVAGALAAIAVGVALWWWLARPGGPGGPADAAREFLSALESGDGERAVELLESAPPREADVAAALDGAAARIEAATVERVSAGAGGATRADVAFDLAGESHEASFGLVETADGWRVAADALGTLTGETTIGDSIAVGDVIVPADAPFALLPAQYPVTAAPRGLLEGEATAVVLPGGSADAAVEASVSPQATERAQARLEEYARACAQPADAVPRNCGLRVPWAADLATLESIAFRIDRMPQLALSPDATAFDATGGVVTATATGTTRDGGTASFTYRADDWALRGTVSFEGDEMVLAIG